MRRSRARYDRWSSPSCSTKACRHVAGKKDSRTIDWIRRGKASQWLRSIAHLLRLSLSTVVWHIWALVAPTAQVKWLVASMQVQSRCRLAHFSWESTIQTPSIKFRTTTSVRSTNSPDMSMPQGTALMNWRTWKGTSEQVVKYSWKRRELWWACLLPCTTSMDLTCSVQRRLKNFNKHSPRLVWRIGRFRKRRSGCLENQPNIYFKLF